MSAVADSRNVAVAATLFSVAAGNGHEGANRMLETTGLQPETLPECLIRETREELEIELDPDSLEYIALIDFHAAGELVGLGAAELQCDGMLGRIEVDQDV